MPKTIICYKICDMCRKAVYVSEYNFLRTTDQWVICNRHTEGEIHAHLATR